MRPLRSKPLFKVGDTILCSMAPELDCDGTHPQPVTDIWTHESPGEHRQRMYRHGGGWRVGCLYCSQIQTQVRRYWKLVESAPEKEEGVKAEIALARLNSPDEA